MGKQNCWEFKKCGREPGGSKAASDGVCPAAAEAALTGANGGRMGGRACWMVAGTLCGNRVQGTFALKSANCMKCDFYALVHAEEGSNAAKPRDLLERMRRAA